MSPPLRINYPDAIYHVMNRGLLRNKIVNGQRYYLEFFKTLSKIHDLWHVQVYAYCIMKNHYHVCLKTPEGNLPLFCEIILFPQGKSWLCPYKSSNTSYLHKILS